MLFGQDLGCRHQRTLVSGSVCRQQGRQCNDGLAASDFALQEPTHRHAARHVPKKNVQGLLLIGGEFEIE